MTLFASAQGAARWLAQEQREDYIRRLMLGGGKLRRFTVPGIPGARGWTASKDAHIVGNIFWVQGRCLMILGNESTGPFDGTLATGAHAIYRRTKGQCAHSGASPSRPLSASCRPFDSGGVDHAARPFTDRRGTA